MVDHQTTALGFHLFARAHQLLALSVHRTQLLFLRSRHPHQREGVLIAFHVAVQLQAKRLGIAPVGLHPLPRSSQLLRADDVALDPERA